MRRIALVVGLLLVIASAVSLVSGFDLLSERCPIFRRGWLAANQIMSEPLIWLMTLIALIVGILAMWWGCHRWSLEFVCTRLHGADLKASRPDAKDGTSAFIALATFALAQGGALTVVARGEGRTAIVLWIYGVSVLFTIVWIVCLLRMTDPADRAARAFSDTSVTYGRFALWWTAFVALIMVFLGANQLLPNQTYRVAYPAGPIQMNPPMLVETAGAAVVDCALCRMRSKLQVGNRC